MAEGVTWVRRPTRAGERPPFIRVMGHERARLWSDAFISTTRRWEGTPCVVWAGPFRRDGVPVTLALGGRTSVVAVLLADLHGLPVSRRDPLVRLCDTDGCVSIAHHDVTVRYTYEWVKVVPPEPAPPKPRRPRTGPKSVPPDREWTARLDPAAVLDIRHRYVVEGVSASALARVYAVAVRTVIGVLKGVSWIDVSGGVDVYRYDGPRHLGGVTVGPKLDADRVRWAVEEYRSGRLSRRVIADRLGVSKSAVDQIMRGDTWRDITGGPVARPVR